MNGQDPDRPKLVILTGKRRGDDLPLVSDRLTIGRTEEADLVVKEKSISRRHAEFERKSGGWVVRDLESKNGLRVNNREVTEQGLHTGDVVALGNLKLKFVDPRELAPLPSAQEAPFPAPAPFPEPGPFPAPAPFPGPPEPAPAPPPFVPEPVSAAPSPAGGPNGGPALVPAVYSPQANLPADQYAPPPEFFAPKMVQAPRIGDRRPLTRRAALVYLAVFAAIGVGLAYLVAVTFFYTFEPFREDVKLSVREVSLLDMVRHSPLLAAASYRVDPSRVAEAKYDTDSAILTVEAKALGNADVIFIDLKGKEIGRVGVHVLKGDRKKSVDRSALTADQLKAQAKELMGEGDRLAKAFLADAVERYTRAVELLAYVEDPPLKAMSVMRLQQLEAERDGRFQNIKDRYRQANKLGDIKTAKDLLDDICRLFPDPSNIEHQRALIFLKRLERKERALKASE